MVINMKKKSILSTKQLTPLIEIIIVMAFFAVAATILVQVFAKAHADSQLAHDINMATLYASEYAEQFRVSGAYDSVISILLLGGFQETDNKENDDFDNSGIVIKKNNYSTDSNVIINNNYYICLDNSFSPISKDAAHVVVTIKLLLTMTDAGQLLTGQIVCVRKDDTELVSLEIAAFFVVNGH